MFSYVFMKIGFTPWFPIHCEKTQLGSHSHTYSGPFNQHAHLQMCCNVMLSVINMVVCLTAPTEQGNKNYTHTDIRMAYNRVAFV